MRPVRTDLAMENCGSAELPGVQVTSWEENGIIITEVLVQNEEGIAMAVDITDTAFVRSCVTGKGKVYIAFPGNTARAELTDDFFDRLLAWTEG